MWSPSSSVTPRRPAHTSAARAVVSATLLVCALSGCSAENPGSPSATSADSGTTAQTTPILPAAAAATTVDADGGVGAHKDLAAPTCTADSAGKWSFSGTIKNPTKATQSHEVEASVVNPDGWSVIGSTSVKAEIAPGATKEVAAKAFYTETAAAAAAKHQCVTRVVRHDK